MANNKHVNPQIEEEVVETEETTEVEEKEEPAKPYVKPEKSRVIVDMAKQI